MKGEEQKKRNRNRNRNRKKKKKKKTGKKYERIKRVPMYSTAKSRARAHSLPTVRSEIGD